MQPRKTQILQACALFSALAGVALTVACGTSTSAPGPTVPLPNSSPILPVVATFTQTSVLTPAASTANKTIIIPLPPTTGFSGTAALAAASIPAGLRMTVTYADVPPAGTKPLDLRSTAGALRAPLDALSTNVVYACIAVNMLVTIDSGPHFTFVLPNSFADPAINYYVAIRQDATWVDGYGGPGLVSAAGGSSEVTLDGRFGFAIPANGQVCVALYGRYKTSSTPVPATAPTPTPEPPITSVANLAFTSLGAQSAQTFSVKEVRYTGTWTETNTCAAFASVATTDHTNFTVTPNAVGSCAITITDSFKSSTKVPVDVTSTTFGVQ